MRRVHRLAKRNEYALRLDVRKYFDHLDHGILRGLLARRIDDPGILWLSETILAHARVPSVPSSERRGIPIGNLTSHFWANVYLDPLDHVVCDSLGHCSCTRHMDDIVVFADQKADRAPAHEIHDQRPPSGAGHAAGRRAIGPGVFPRGSPHRCYPWHITRSASLSLHRTGEGP